MIKHYKNHLHISIDNLLGNCTLFLKYAKSFLQKATTSFQSGSTEISLSIQPHSIVSDGIPATHPHVKKGVKDAAHYKYFLAQLHIKLCVCVCVDSLTGTKRLC